jgi:hypothetical protein
MRQLATFAVSLLLLTAASASAQSEDTSNASTPSASSASVATPNPANGAWQLRPSLAWSVVTDERTHGLGGGLELIRFPNASAWRVGVFSEAFGELDGAARVAGGLSFGYGMFGLQAGVAHRTEGDYAAATSLQIAKTLTFGPAGIALRMGIPLHTYGSSQDFDLPSRGVELAVVVQVGWSFTLSGARPPHTHSCHGHGHH